MRIGLLGCVALTACITPDLVPCGDNSCPQGTICLAGSRCVTQGALDACSGTADGTLCTVDSTIGICANGACTLARCGDGILEPGEGCDGGVPAGTDCSYFGYYHGDLTCSNTCQLDTASCAGRCGDGAIDSDQGEYCDGSLPVGASCFDFGYDVGALACGESCGADLGDCHQLHWERAFNIHDSLVDIWGGDGRLGLVAANGTAWLTDHGSRVTAPGTGYAAIAGSEGSMWAAGPTALAWWTPNGGWASQAPPWTANRTIHDVWASDTLGVYVSTNQDAALWHFDGTSWTQIAGAWGAGASFGQPEDTLYVIDPNQVSTWDGSTWGSLALQATVAIATGGDGVRYIIAAGYGYYQVIADTQSWEWTSGYPPLGLAPTVSGVFATAALFDVPGGPYTGGMELGVAASGLDWPFPGGGVIAGDGRGVVYTATSNGLYALAKGEWVSDLSDSTNATVMFDRAGASTVEDYEAQTTLSPWGEETTVPTGCDLGETIGPYSYCWMQSGGTIEIATPDGTTGVTTGSVAAMWIAGDGTSAATVGDHAFAWGTDLAWQTAAPPIAFSAVAGDSVNDLYALGLGDGDTVVRMWHFDGASWTAITAPLVRDLQSLVVDTATAYATSGGQLVAVDRATDALTTPSTGLTLGLLSGRGAELFATGSDATGTSPLWFFNGVSWSPVRVPPNILAFPIVGLWDGGAQLYANVGLDNHYQAQMYRLVRTGPWLLAP